MTDSPARGCTATAATAPAAPATRAAPAAAAASAAVKPALTEAAAVAVEPPSPLLKGKPRPLLYQNYPTRGIYAAGA